ncbi:MAG: nucleoside-diphosphate kinase [candidate division WOR-3 bacterium]|nr:nucleoside-diphosphate kinase [candidate division WOR-3 bacterium]
MSRTLLLVKPDATERNLGDEILDIIRENGFRIIRSHREKMNRHKAERFYAVHRDKDFFNALIDYMTSGETLGVILESDNAVEKLRELIGDTDPGEADPDSIRGRYGQTLRRNSVHGSDCNQSAKHEIEVFFKE